MKTFLRILKWISIIVVVLVIILVVSVNVFKNRTFDAPTPNITASKDSAVIARGAYLVNGPTHCMHCHTPNNQMPKVDMGEVLDMTGGHEFDLGPIGKYYSANLTPDKETGIGNFTDGEIARTLRYGVKKDGRTMINLMPFQDISDADLTAIISYLRTLKPVANKVPENDRTFLGKALFAFMIKPVGPSQDIRPIVNIDTTPEYGQYLAYSVANCYGCHTDRNLKTGEFIGEPFAGGCKLPCEIDLSKTLVTPNITTDGETGKLANWTEGQFVTRFRQGKMLKETIMPWGPFSRMSDLELKAIYRFLKTVKPIKRDNGAVLVNTAELD